MPAFTCFKFRFNPGWVMIFLSMLFICLFIRLGLWQLQRAEEKRKMIDIEASQAAQAPIWLNANQKLPDQYQRVRLKGSYLTHLLLLDNQHYQHQFGYDVISPLLLADGRVILVDRGWIPGDNARLSFPEIKIPGKYLKLQGSVYFPSKNPWILGPGMEKKQDKLTIIENIDPKLISQLLQKKVSPFIIRLDARDANGFVRNWPIVSMPPQRHSGYAVQWFAMALVILILFVALNLKKDNEKI